MEFRQIVSNYSIKNKITITPKYDFCPDIIFGVLINGVVAERRRDIAKIKIRKPAIILVLESPHIEEFKGKLEPAMGTTGDNIKDFLITFDAVGLPIKNNYIIIRLVAPE